MDHLFGTEKASKKKSGKKLHEWLKHQKTKQIMKAPLRGSHYLFFFDARTLRVFLLGAMSFWEPPWKGPLKEYYEHITSEKYRQERAVALPRDTEKRAVALAARKRLRDARWLQRKVDANRLLEHELDAAQLELLARHRTGSLLRERNEANKAYGFGEGAVDGLSIEDIITIGRTTQDLHSYLAS